MEYAEYKPVEQGIDFSALTDKLATKVDDIGKDRAARKEELDTLASDTSRKFSEMEMTKTESLNDKLLALGDEGREKVNNWNTELKAGRLSPSEYKKRMAGLSEYVGLVGSTAKTFDERIQTHLKRQETGEAGVVEAEIANRLGMLADLSKTDYRVLDDGSIAIDVKDPSTGEVYRTEDLGRINKTENIVSNKIDLPKNVNSTVKLWGKDGVYELLGMRGYTTSASASNDKDYLLAEQRLIDSVMTQGDASVLLDNGGVTYPSFAYSDGEYKKKLEEAKLDVQRRNKKIGVSEELSQEDLDQIEMSIIKMDANGKPLLTDKQKEKAEELIRSEIRLQVDNELKLVAPQVNIGGKSGTGKTVKETTNYYPEMRRAWDMGGVEGGNQLTALAEGRAKFVFVDGGLKVLKPRKPSEQDKKSRSGNKSIWEQDGEIITDLSAIQNYIYPKGNKNFDAHRQEYIDEHGLGDTVPNKPKGTKPKITSGSPV